MTEPKLKHCPFCPGEARVTGSESVGTINYYYVYCVDCGARTGEYATKKSAIEAWNRRASEVAE